MVLLTAERVEEGCEEGAKRDGLQRVAKKGLHRGSWRDNYDELSVPAEAKQFGRDNKTQCPPEMENLIRVNGPPNTPQVRNADSYVNGGRVI